MRLKKSFIIALMAFLVLVISFLYLTPFTGKLVANTRLERYAKSVGISIIKESPPLPSVTSGKTQIPVIQSSYCWGKLGWVDHIGGKTMFQGKTPTVVAPEANVKISFIYKPAPNKLNVQRFNDDKTIQISLKDGFFNAPKEKGIYYYGISAFWTTDDGKYSKGDTSSVFVIEVN